MDWNPGVHGSILTKCKNSTSDGAEKSVMIATKYIEKGSGVKRAFGP
jgi:hypothetical protein